MMLPESKESHGFNRGSMSNIHANYPGNRRKWQPLYSVRRSNFARDLYSAFLIRNADLDFKHPDREKCEYEFEHFANLQDQLILKMKESGLSMRQCFGF